MPGHNGLGAHIARRLMRSGHGVSYNHTPDVKQLESEGRKGQFPR